MIKVIEGWYSAREFVLEQLSKDKNMGAEGISPSSSDNVHVIIHYTVPMALFIARQVALVTHFPNFKEGDGKGAFQSIVLRLRFYIIVQCILTF